MSYRKAWGDVRAIEGHLGFAVLDRQRGGRGGGESKLTQQGEKLLDAYSKIKNDMEGLAQEKFKLNLKKILVQPKRTGKKRKAKALRR